MTRRSNCPIARPSCGLHCTCTRTVARSEISPSRSSGINRPTFEAEVKIKDKIYLLEVDDTGLLISKSLEAGEDRSAAGLPLAVSKLYALGSSHRPDRAASKERNSARGSLAAHVRLPGSGR